MDEDHGEVVVHFTITQEGLNLKKGLKSTRYVFQIANSQKIY